MELNTDFIHALYSIAYAFEHYVTIYWMHKVYKVEQHKKAGALVKKKVLITEEKQMNI